MEESFVRHVVRTSAFVAVAVGFIGWGAEGWQWALTFGLAAAWSMVNLIALQSLLTLWVKGESRAALWAVFFLKVPVLYGLILMYLIAAPWRPSSLVGGISLPYAVIVCKAVGHLLLEAMGRKNAPAKSGADKP